MKRVPIRASKSVSHAGSRKVATVRLSNGTKTISGKASIKTR